MHANQPYQQQGQGYAGNPASGGNSQMMGQGNNVTGRTPEDQQMGQGQSTMGKIADKITHPFSSSKESQQYQQGFQHGQQTAQMGGAPYDSTYGNNPTTGYGNDAPYGQNPFTGNSTSSNEPSSYGQEHHGHHNHHEHNHNSTGNYVSDHNEPGTGAYANNPVQTNNFDQYGNPKPTTGDKIQHGIRQMKQGAANLTQKAAASVEQGAGNIRRDVGGQGAAAYNSNSNY